jgi:hypothetical protein
MTAILLSVCWQKESDFQNKGQKVQYYEVSSGPKYRKRKPKYFFV